MYPFQPNHAPLDLGRPTSRSPDPSRSSLPPINTTPPQLPQSDYLGHSSQRLPGIETLNLGPSTPLQSASSPHLQFPLTPEQEWISSDMAKRRSKGTSEKKGSANEQTQLGMANADESRKNDSRTQKDTAAQFLMTPPPSSETFIHHSFSSATDSGTQDPVLYQLPNGVSHHIPDNVPLFIEPKTSTTLDSRIREHSVTFANKFKRARLSSPSIDDYLLVAHVLPAIKRTGTHAWMNQEWGWMQAVGRPSNTEAGRKILQDASPNRRQLKRIAPKSGSEARKRHSATAPRVQRAPKARKPMQLVDGETPAPRKRAKPTPSKVETLDYTKLRDFAPHESTMRDGAAAARRCSVNGEKGARVPSPISLEDDPDRHMLSQPEITVAEKLRLPGAKFLYQKRKIFQGVIDTLRKGKEYKKTNAQDSRKIDVNKLSQLWLFYSDVGWFDRSFYTKWLNMSDAEWEATRVVEPAIVTPAE